MKSSFGICVLSCCLGFIGCQSKPKTFGYPYLVPAGEREAAFSCRQLDVALHKTDAIRWSMRMEGYDGELLPEKLAKGVVGCAASVAMFTFDPVNASVYGVASAAYPFVKDSITAADYRIISLLELKRKKACTPESSQIDEQSDLQVLRTLVALEQRCDDDELSKRELMKQRTRLLDALYPEGTE